MLSSTFSEDWTPFSENDDSILEPGALVRSSPPSNVELPPLKTYSSVSWARMSCPVGIVGSKDGCLVPFGEMAWSCFNSASVTYCKTCDGAAIQIDREIPKI